MLLSSVDLNLLVAFEALYQSRSVTRAAFRLGVSQPAMSATLARLRSAFGDELFVRAGREMRPTPRTEALAPALLASLDSLRSALGQPGTLAPLTGRQTFRIGSTDFTTLVLLPGVVANVRRLAPGATVCVSGYEKSRLGERLAGGDLEFALGVFPSPPSRCVVRSLCSERFVGLARVGHPVLRSGPPDLARYAAQPHALVSVNGDMRGEIDLELEKMGLSRRIELVVPQMTILPQILETTDLVAAVPARFAAALGGPGLATFEIPLRLAAWRIQMMWDVSRRRDPSARWLRECVLEAARRI